jgi:hypothetical protein
MINSFPVSIPGGTQYKSEFLETNLISVKLTDRSPDILFLHDITTDFKGKKYDKRKYLYFDRYGGLYDRCTYLL